MFELLNLLFLLLTLLVSRTGPFHMIPREMVPREIVLLGSMFGKRPEIQQNDVSKLTLLCTFFLLTNPTAPLIVHNSKYS